MKTREECGGRQWCCACMVVCVQTRRREADYGGRQLYRGGPQALRVAAHVLRKYACLSHRHCFCADCSSDLAAASGGQPGHYIITLSARRTPHPPRHLRRGLFHLQTFFHLSCTCHGACCTRLASVSSLARPRTHAFARDTVQCAGVRGGRRRGWGSAGRHARRPRGASTPTWTGAAAPAQASPGGHTKASVQNRARPQRL